jgi:hypothetical protein
MDLGVVNATQPRDMQVRVVALVVLVVRLDVRAPAHATGRDE